MEPNNILAGSLTITWVLVFLIMSEVLAHKNKISKENARKMIHIAVGNVIFFIPIYEDRWLAVAIPLSFVFGNYLLSPNSPIDQMKLRTFEAGHSNGTIYYPLSLAIAVFVFFEDPQLILAAFFPLVYGDGFAAVIGPRSNSRRFTTWGGEKTVAGTITLFLAAFFSTLIGNALLATYVPKSFDFGTILTLALLVAIIGTLAELYSPRGMDNLVIPICLTLLLLFIKDRDMLRY